MLAITKYGILYTLTINIIYNCFYFRPYHRSFECKLVWKNLDWTREIIMGGCYNVIIHFSVSFLCHNFYFWLVFAPTLPTNLCRAAEAEQVLLEVISKNDFRNSNSWEIFDDTTVFPLFSLDSETFFIYLSFGINIFINNLLMWPNRKSKVQVRKFVSMFYS